ADIYLPSLENPPFLAQSIGYVVTHLALVMRTDRELVSLNSSLRTAIAAIDGSVVVLDMQPMGARVASSLAARRQILIVLALFSIAALVLAGAGLYGVLAYLVNQQIPEIGIRMALGAGKQDILRMVLGRGLLLTCAGLGAGTVISLAATRMIS